MTNLLQILKDDNVKKAIIKITINICLVFYVAFSLHNGDYKEITKILELTSIILSFTIV